MTTNARTLQILLDLVNHLATDRSKFLPDPRFTGLLDEPELELAAHLAATEPLLEQLPADSAVRIALARCLRGFGMDRMPSERPEERRSGHCWGRSRPEARRLGGPALLRHPTNLERSVKALWTSRTNLNLKAPPTDLVPHPSRIGPVRRPKTAEND